MSANKTRTLLNKQKAYRYTKLHSQLVSLAWQAVFVLRPVAICLHLVNCQNNLTSHERRQAASQKHFSTYWDKCKIERVSLTFLHTWCDRTHSMLRVFWMCFTNRMRAIVCAQVCFASSFFFMCYTRITCRVWVLGLEIVSRILYSSVRGREECQNRVNERKRRKRTQREREGKKKRTKHVIETAFIFHTR